MSASDLVPSPIEQRLRRTFATRAEDMAPGDGAAGDQDVPLALTGLAVTGPADRAYEPGQERRPRPFQLVAAIVVIIGTLAALGVVVANGDGGRDGEETSDRAGDGSGGPVAATVELITAPREVVTALQDERSLATFELIGMAQAVEMPVHDTGVARSRTDDVAMALQSVVAADPAGSAYQAALDDLGGLGALRHDVDANHAPRDIFNGPFASEVFDRYTDMVGGLLDAQGEVARSTGDPDVGAQVYPQGLHLQELSAQLGSAALLDATDPSRPLLPEVTRLYTLVRQSRDALLAEATATPYETAVVTALEETSGLVDIVADGLEADTEVVALLDAMALPRDQGWPAFLDRVEDLMAPAEG